MQNFSSRRIRVAVVLSVLWVCGAYILLAGDDGRISGPKLVEFGMIPLVLGWGILWALGGRATTETATATTQVTTTGFIAGPASAWVRACARWFDLMLWSTIIGYPLGYALAEVLPKIVPPSPEQPFTWFAFASFIFLMVSLPICLLLDALAYRWFGNTPGKALLGLSVRTRTDSALSAEQYLARNVAMWGPGLGFGLPGIQLIALFLSERALKKQGETRWDGKWGYSVSRAPRQVWRVGAFCVLAIVMLAISKLDERAFSSNIQELAIAQASQSFEHNERRSAPQPTYAAAQAASLPAAPSQVTAPSKVAAPSKLAARAHAWINPVSGISSELAGRWRESPSLEDRNYAWVFISESGEIAAVNTGPHKRILGA
jgi:hypothetical protein